MTQAIQACALRARNARPNSLQANLCEAGQDDPIGTLRSGEERRAAGGTDGASGAQFGHREPHGTGRLPIRGLLAEFGIAVAQGIEKLRGQLPDIPEGAENGLPALARETLAELLEQWRNLDERVTHYDRQIAQWAAASELSAALDGNGRDRVAHGDRGAVASVGDAKVFESGRQFAAWLGMVPRQHSAVAASSV